MEKTNDIEIANKALTAMFYNITMCQDIVTVLKNALDGKGFNAINEEANFNIWFYSQFTPSPLPEDPDLTPIRDAFLPDTVVIAADSYASQDLTGEDEFIYTYPCGEFCDRLQEYLDQHYYPDHRDMRDTVDPLVDQLRAALPTPGTLPDTATYDDKIRLIIDRWLKIATTKWLYPKMLYHSFPERMAGIARKDTPHTGYYSPICFPWTPTGDPTTPDNRPSDPGTVLLIAGGQTSRQIHEGEHFETAIPADMFCDMVHDWLEANWYPDHQDERADVETSLKQLRHALSTP